jgi:Protein of unknown function (DUF1614)
MACGLLGWRLSPPFAITWADRAPGRGNRSAGVRSGGDDRNRRPAPECWQAAPLGYISGSLSTLIGADLINLDKAVGLGAPIASIGGPGRSTAVFLNLAARAAEHSTNSLAA